MTTFRLALVVPALFFALLVSAAQAASSVTELNVIAPKHRFPSVGRSYPSMDKVYSRAGLARTVAQVRRIRLGSSQKDVVRAIGNPISAYSDGSWNFNVSLDFPQSHRLICQYRVWFDDDLRVAGTAWRRPQCAQIIQRGHGN